MNFHVEFNVLAFNIFIFACSGKQKMCRLKVNIRIKQTNKQTKNKNREVQQEQVKVGKLHSSGKDGIVS